MSRTGRILGGLAVATVALTAVRIGLAVRMLRRDRRSAPPPEPEAEERVLVLQAVLGGDPTLEANLRENLANHPRARFRWLVDRDDPVGRRAATAVAGTGRDPDGTGACVEIFPPPPPTVNPKVFKLAGALRREAERDDRDGRDPDAVPWVAVLDDDTILPPGTLAAAVARLERSDLVTGLPRYRIQGGLWSRLVAAFVNANALVTYLPVLAFQPPVTVNGMFVVTRRRTLRELGGFDAILSGLCDDYELARLYRRAGLGIEQTTLAHPLVTTVPDLASYLRLMRRWMVFAQRLLRDAPSLPALALVVLPSLLPAAVVAASVGAARERRSPAPLLVAPVLLLGKAVALGVVRSRWLGTRERLRDQLLEVAADLLQPLHVVSAAIRPTRIRWRSRQIAVRDGEIRWVG